MQITKQSLVRYALLSILFVVLSGLLLWGLRKNTQSFYFQDETDHLVMGWMMNFYDKTLYKELSTNHQPIPVFMGAALLKVVPYTTLFDLVERLRLGMLAFFLVAGVGLVSRFKERGLWAFFLTFATGYYFFAWHILAESLATPAVLYLVLLVGELLFPKPGSKTALNARDAIVAAVALVWIGFNLLPLWPFCLVVALYLFWQATAQVRWQATLTALLAVGAVFTIAHPTDWYRETITNNLRYFIAYQAPLTPIEWLRVAVYPFLSFAQPSGRIHQIFLFPLLIVFSLAAYRWYQNRSISQATMLKIIGMYIGLILLNPRVYEFPVAFYNAFHLFPYVGGFFALIAIAVFRLTNFHKLSSQLALLAVVLPLFLLNLSWAFPPKDKLNEYYVQYGTYESYAQLVKVLAQPGDTLFSAPDGHGYMNIISTLPIAGRQLFHLQWAYRSPQLRQEFHDLFAQTPPPFVYLTEDESGYHTDLVPILAAQYTPILHNQKTTHLYIRSDRVHPTPAQAQYMAEKDFTFALK